MKNKLSIFSLFFAVILTSCGQKKEFSKEALDMKLVALSGSQISFQEILDAHKGKTVVIEVWASWCGDCIKAMPKLKELQANHPEVDFVFISMDKAFDKFKDGIAKHELKGDHYWATDGMKGRFGSSIDLDWIPRYIVIDKNQKVVIYKAIETDFKKIDKTLNKLK